MAEAIIRGQPDWGKSAEHTFTGTGQSDFELGSRLKWPFAQAYDGEIHFFDDFEAGILHWDADVTAGDVQVAFSALYANSNGHSIALTSPDDDGESVWISKGIPNAVSPVVSLGLYVYRSAEVNYTEFDIYPTYNARQLGFTLRYNWATGDIQVRTPTGYVSVGSYPSLVLYTSEFSFVRMVVDMENKLYKQVQFGSSVINLDQDSWRDLASPYGDRFELVIEHYTDGLVPSTIYVDDVIVTRNVQLPQE